jgi:hypothetical protein
MITSMPASGRVKVCSAVSSLRTASRTVSPGATRSEAVLKANSWMRISRAPTFASAARVVRAMAVMMKEATIRPASSSSPPP